eukprot:4611499-Pleurochrysis_carterae.AAC.1
MTSLGCSRHGTNGTCRVGADTQPSRVSASTAAAAAAAWLTRPGWWKARTVRSSQSERTSTPPSPTWSTMSVSGHCSTAAAARSAARSSRRGPSNVVWRDDRCTGVHLRGSAQSQTTPRAHGAMSDCSMTTGGTGGTSTSRPAARSRSAATASSAWRNQRCTLP